jgi:orotidine-5'-phosphate decarboxylase
LDAAEKLKQIAIERGSIVCMGMDPVEAKLPESITGSTDERIVKFYMEILEAITSQNIPVGAVKPNMGYYSCHGTPGLIALKKLIDAYQKAGFPVILDGKRGDIDRSSAVYATEVFTVNNADWTTVNPYMGHDCISPFTKHCDEGKGVYLLCRTSNDGAKDIQDLELTDGRKVFEAVADNIAGKWHKPGVGAVVGATSPDELRSLSERFVKSGAIVPILIPGVGAQGGSAKDVAEILRATGNPLGYHRISSSSGISFAYQKAGTDDYVGAAIAAIKKLNEEIGSIE